MRVLISDFSNIVYTSQKVVQLKNQKLMKQYIIKLNLHTEDIRPVFPHWRRAPAP